MASFLLLTVGAIASSASAASPVAPQRDGALLTRALHTWATFPVRSSPRPLVVLEGPVLGPEGGFANDNGKTAFIEGDIVAPARWPVSAISSLGFPLIAPAAAFEELKIPTGTGLPAAPPLTTTSVELGSAQVLTDRGYRILPTWDFTLAGVVNPAKVLAVDPSAIAYVPATPQGTSPAHFSVTVSGAGRHLVANFSGYPSGTGPCTASYSLMVKESTRAVALAVVAHSHGSGTQGCLLVASLRHADAELKAPLGARVVVDAVSDGPVAATGSPLH